ncbi:hypothetical protein [Neptunicella marina]|uniref:YfhG lipoprotein n=1 Tax=Neptunicella marina TaxID=2125989 RepID=A0A8J6IN50_9ALTE|nr:hypothetical protein [Neptunicella marina]MBC3764416.1 hypothetical protein [Neptunicella marina]
MRIILTCGLLTLLAGCQLLPLEGREPAEISYACADSDKLNLSDEPCNLLGWFNYRQKIDNLSWPERKKRIATLSDSKVNTLKKIILSQNTTTPYQSRLRAQNQLNELKPALPKMMSALMSVWVLQPSQKLLEFESALVTLGKINARQSQTIDEQKLQIEQLEQQHQQQQDQIEQLMNIETSLSEKEQQDEG